MANVRDKILRFRNHPSIVLWCARNEGYPAAGDRRGAAQAAGGVGADAPLSAQLDRRRRGALARAVFLACAARVLYDHRRLLQDRNRQRLGAHAGIDSRHDAEEGLGDRSTTTGPSTILPKATRAQTSIRQKLPRATERFAILPTLCARRNWRTTRPSAPCTRGAMRSCSIRRRPSLRG